MHFDHLKPRIKCMRFHYDRTAIISNLDAEISHRNTSFESIKYPPTWTATMNKLKAENHVKFTRYDYLPWVICAENFEDCCCHRISSNESSFLPLIISEHVTPLL